MSKNIPAMGSCTPPPSLRQRKLSQKDVESVICRLYKPKSMIKDEEGMSVASQRNLEQRSLTTKKSQWRRPKSSQGRRQHKDMEFLSCSPRPFDSFEKTEEWYTPLHCPHVSSPRQSQFQSWHARAMEQHRSSKERLALEKMIHQHEIMKAKPKLCPGTKRILERRKAATGKQKVFSRLTSKENTTVAAISSSYHFHRQPGGFSFRPCRSPQSEKLNRKSGRRPHSYIDGHYSTSWLNSKDDFNINYYHQFTFQPKILEKSKQLVRKTGSSFEERLDRSVRQYEKTPVKPKVSSPGVYTGSIIHFPL